MAELPHRLGPLRLPASDTDLRALAGLLVDAVDSGAAVSFLAPLAAEAADPRRSGSLRF